MLIAKWLLAIGVFLVVGGAGIGVYGLTQHPGEASVATQLHPDQCLLVELNPGSGPPAAASDAHTRSPDPEHAVLVCGASAAGAGTNKGLPVDVPSLVNVLRDAQRWLAFVAFGILMVAVGLAFLTSAGFVSVMTAVLTGRTTIAGGPTPPPDAPAARPV
ncbi:hypothetical protein BayCH28_23235 [Mycolicibacterium sp. CH28]|uniref:hypothetical protein n=1 Tax=Mycolicibacterium sp. CH28 TaxID=2512237 RepID=UPI00108187F1|nr:hypothetical protein [Mycolicibacterium sp. CH28]TGD84844.1 hypothetical protein BayCH28_23235 [Mycolicibacterium sp. CH28]